MSFADRINACNNADTSGYLSFIIDGRQVGWLKPGFADELSAWPELFIHERNTIRLSPDLAEFEQRSEAVDSVIRALVSAGVIDHYLSEPYPVTPGSRDHAMMVIDRSSAAYFGIRCFGQHLNGYVRQDTGLHLWIARRARDRRIFPGRLDNLVAGGLPWHTGLHENLLKECMEEAGMPAELAASSVPVGEVSYLAETAKGIKPDILYCYDLELPATFMPVCTDGEVESFELMPVEAVKEIVRESEEFKPNCNLVIIDFLVRHGLLDAGDGDPDGLAGALRRAL